MFVQMLAYSILIMLRILQHRMRIINNCRQLLRNRAAHTHIIVAIVVTRGMHACDARAVLSPPERRWGIAKGSSAAFCRHVRPRRW